MEKTEKKIELKKQFAALVFQVTAHGVHFLLLDSRDSRQPIIPKGRPEFVKKKPIAPYLVAAKEAKEEAGVKGRIGRKSIGQFFYKKRYSDRTERCVVSVYLMRFEKQSEEWKEKGQRRIEWVTGAQAVQRLAANSNVLKPKENLEALFAEAERRIFRQEKARRGRAKKKDLVLSIKVASKG